MNRAQWFDHLHDLAPHAGDLLLHTLAGVLAAPTHPEALLIVADALIEAADAVPCTFPDAPPGDMRRIRRLADAVTREAAYRTHLATRAKKEIAR